MSGTSADGVDAALVEWPDDAAACPFRLLGFQETPFEAALQERIHRLAAGRVAGERALAELASLGLSPPRARLRVEGRAGPEGPVEILADLRFGRLAAGRGLFVQGVGQSTAFLIDPDAAEALPYSLDHYRFAFEFEYEDADDAPPEIDPRGGADAP